MTMKALIKQLIAATNAYDVEKAVALFAPDAVIDDVSVGSKFENRAGVRAYIEKFFVGYHTVSKLESVERLAERRAKAHLDFTGDFGHETGFLDITINADGLIAEVAADLD
jgi:ketosteroid isomerase-like protein